MITPTFYRSLLTPEERELYKVIVNGLLRFENTIIIRNSVEEHDVIQKVIRAVHLDHPELFYVDFWHVHLLQDIFSFGIQIEFQMLIDQTTAYSVTNTLSEQAKELSKDISQIIGINQQYYQVIRKISDTTSYVDSRSAFWDHTAAGPALSGKAVCEGIAKLFLFFCQRNQLPCAIVSGTLNGSPHAWNMVETRAGIRYVDVTGLLSSASLYLLYPSVMYKTEKQLYKSGYKWNNSYR